MTLQRYDRIAPFGENDLAPCRESLELGACSRISQGGNNFKKCCVSVDDVGAAVWSMCGCQLLMLLYTWLLQLKQRCTSNSPPHMALLQLPWALVPA